jgi:hypothetical protein
MAANDKMDRGLDEIIADKVGAFSAARYCIDLNLMSSPIPAQQRIAKPSQWRRS